MAKLRQNHRKSSNPGSIIARGGIFAILFGILYVAFRVLGIDVSSPGNNSPSPGENPGSESSTRMSFLPSGTGDVVHHTYYSMSYREEFEQPEWVAYRLTKEVMSGPYVKRCLLYTSPSPRDATLSRMPSSA